MTITTLDDCCCNFALFFCFFLAKLLTEGKEEGVSRKRKHNDTIYIYKCISKDGGEGFHRRRKILFSLSRNERPFFVTIF